MESLRAILSSKIKTFRNSIGKSQENFSREIETSCQTFARWERGDFLPSIDKVESISKGLGVEPWELFYPGDVEHMKKAMQFADAIPDNMEAKEAISFFNKGLIGGFSRGEE